MRPCIRCYAAIGNAEDPCPECGAPQSRPTATSDPVPEDSARDHEVSGSDFQIEWLYAIAILSGVTFVALSHLVFGPAGMAVSLGFFVFCAILWGIVTSGGI